MRKWQLLIWLFVQYISLSQIIVSVNCFCEFCANKCNHGPNFHHWILEEKQLSPDNYQQTGKVINGQFPGPTIRIFPNEYLVVKVENRLPAGITIHWHGLHQQRTLSSDGVEQVTQYPIPTNGSYTYCLFIHWQVGTFLYHAHNNMDIIWIHGALIVEDPGMIWRNPGVYLDYKYDEDRIIILEELYHVSVEEFMTMTLVTGERRPVVESLLINGKSYGKWPNSSNKTCEECGYDVINVRKCRTYRFRLINLSSDVFLRFAIKNHTMTVIEMDGIYTKPIKVNYVMLHTAQRYSVLVNMDQEMGNYWMESELIPGPGPRNGAAILHYEGAPETKTLRTVVRNGESDPIPDNDEWITSQLYPNPDLIQDVYPIPQKIDRTIKVDFQFVAVPPVQKFSMNGHIFMEPEIPYLYQLRDGVNITDELQVFEILEGQGVLIILQNRAAGFMPCEIHPWHFHGRAVYVVAEGPDGFNEERDVPMIKKRVREGKGQFQFRDVFIAFPKQRVKNSTAGAACGWYAVLFRANNNGVWLNHCHITPHMIMGKMFVIWEHSVNNPSLYGE